VTGSDSRRVELFFAQEHTKNTVFLSVVFQHFSLFPAEHRDVVNFALCQSLQGALRLGTLLVATSPDRHNRTCFNNVSIPQCFDGLASEMLF